MSLINTNQCFNESKLLEGNFNIIRNNSNIATYNDYYDYYDNEYTNNLNGFVPGDKLLINEGRFVFDRILGNNGSTFVYNIRFVNGVLDNYNIIEGIPKKTIFEIRSDITSVGWRDNFIGRLDAYKIYKNIIFDIYFINKGTSQYGGKTGHALFIWAAETKFYNCVFIIHSPYMFLNYYNASPDNTCKSYNCTFITDVNFGQSYSGNNGISLTDCVFNKTGYQGTDSYYNKPLYYDNSYANQNIDLSTYKCTDLVVNNIAGVYSGENAWKD